MSHLVTPADILPAAEYAAVRKERRAAVIEKKRHRRLEVGPHAAFYFENFETIWLQIQEMLHIEKGGPDQIQGELDAYNPLIPNGHELVATVMFEVADEARRKAFLARLGGVEETAFIRFASETVHGIPEQDQDRTNADGKASAVQFVHFPFTDGQIALFKTTPAEDIVIGFKHPAYGHMTALPAATKDALLGDFGVAVSL